MCTKYFKYGCSPHHYMSGGISAQLLSILSWTSKGAVSCAYISRRDDGGVIGCAVPYETNLKDPRSAQVCLLSYPSIVRFTFW